MYHTHKIVPFFKDADKPVFFGKIRCWLSGFCYALANNNVEDMHAKWCRREVREANAKLEDNYQKVIHLEKNPNMALDKKLNSLINAYDTLKKTLLNCFLIRHFRTAYAKERYEELLMIHSEYPGSYIADFIHAEKYQNIPESIFRESIEYFETMEMPQLLNSDSNKNEKLNKL